MDGTSKTSSDTAFADLFGPLALTMLHETPISPVWRVAFVANFFTGPIYRDLQERFGLSRPGFVILFSLSRQPGLVARDICLVTGLPKNSISRAVSDLLSAGLIHRATDDADKRAKPLALTEAGEALLAQVVPLFEARQKAMFAALSEGEAAEFDRLIGKLLAGMPGWVEAD